MQVRISETYDLSTQVGKMGLVAIHTPDVGAIARRWNGLLQNHKFMRLVSCDVTMACASMLPADPLQIGVEAGDIAPQDMFNPILYTAVSNDSFNNIINRIMFLTKNNNVGSSIDAVNDPKFGVGATPEGVIEQADQFKLYYALLSQPGVWRKSMPQSGLEMKGLYPIVYSLVNTIGNQQVIQTGATASGAFDQITSVDVSALGGPKLDQRDLGTTIRGRSERMPSIPTFQAVTLVTPTINAAGTEMKTVATPTEIPKCYVGAIIMPPAKLNKLYYRMRVTWTVEFTAPRPIDDIVNWSALETIGNLSYGTDYAEQSRTMSVTTNSVDAQNAEVNLIMEGA